MKEVKVGEDSNKEDGADGTCMELVNPDREVANSDVFLSSETRQMWTYLCLLGGHASRICLSYMISMCQSFLHTPYRATPTRINGLADISKRINRLYQTWHVTKLSNSSTTGRWSREKRPKFWKNGPALPSHSSLITLLRLVKRCFMDLWWVPLKWQGRWRGYQLCLPFGFYPSGGRVIKEWLIKIYY